jgi:hypothetical protein
MKAYYPQMQEKMTEVELEVAGYEDFDPATIA